MARCDNVIMEKLGRIEEGISVLNKKFDELNSYGCDYGRKTDGKIDTHCVQHKTAYAVFALLAGVVGWVMSRFAPK